jgi:hypothetical protein
VSVEDQKPISPTSSIAGPPVTPPLRAHDHVGDPRFHALLKEIGDLHDKKQRDYGTDSDPFANVRGSLSWGVSPWVGAMVRANDKIKRLQKYALYGGLSNESARDSFMDLAVYALIGLILHDEEEANDQGSMDVDEFLDSLDDLDDSNDPVVEVDYAALRAAALASLICYNRRGEDGACLGHSHSSSPTGVIYHDALE